MITLGDYLIVSGMLFTIGFAGVMLRRNIIIILMALELMLNAANLSLVAFSRFHVDPSGVPNYNAQVFVFFIRFIMNVLGSKLSIAAFQLYHLRNCLSNIVVEFFSKNIFKILSATER